LPANEAWQGGCLPGDKSGFKRFNVGQIIQKNKKMRVRGWRTDRDRDKGERNRNKGAWE
jgi:hypothetical protein